MSEPTQPPQRPRIIATDLDGTLLRSDGTVSPRTRAALGRAEDAGLCIVFVTGRPPRWMESLTEVIGRHGVAICSNGGAVYDVRRKRLQRSYPLSAADSLAVVRALRAGLPGVTFAFEYPGGFSHEPDYPAILWDAGAAEQIAPAERLLGAGASGADAGADEADAGASGEGSRGDGAGRAGGCGGEAGVFKILAKHPTLTPDEFLAAGRKLVGDLAEVTRSSPIALLEISAAGVSKASTLAAWCAERGVAAHEVAAFGDMPNDLPMLAWAGAAYAVANAHPEVLAATRRRAESNDDDGVAKVLERLLSAAP